jgi:hypothetical protein
MMTAMSLLYIIDALMSIVDDLREGFSEQDLDQLEWAMNVEYIEPLDDDK